VELVKELPEKLYYSISEVADYTGVKAHVLRYWESEFPTLRPKKNRAGNRSYRKRDVDEVLAIKKLLYDDGFKIDGARRLLREAGGQPEQLDLIHLPAAAQQERKVAQLRRDLRDLLEFVREL
jgi:DNA-binding transcriptional MerR regulator